MNKLNRATKKHILVLLGRFLDPSLLPRFISIDDMDHTFWAKLKKKNVIVIKSDNKVLKQHCVSSELKNTKAILTDFFLFFLPRASAKRRIMLSAVYVIPL